jgi:uncharacterized protein YndB with AHSA1/START domain
MAALAKSIDISRRPEEVFSYATDFSHYPDWQGSVVSAHLEGDLPLAVGSRAVVTRRVGPRQVRGTEELTELDPPRSWAVRGTGGPLTASAKGRIEPLDDGKSSRLTIVLDFEGHGIGSLCRSWSAGRRGSSCRRTRPG